MILGCAQSDPKLVKLDAPIIIRDAPIACPAPPQSANTEARRGAPPPPAFDTVDGRGQPALSETATRGWIDAHALAIDRKNGVIAGLLREARACRDEQMQPIEMKPLAKTS